MIFHFFTAPLFLFASESRLRYDKLERSLIAYFSHSDL